VWVVCAESHYSVLFARGPADPTDATNVVDLVYYDPLGRQTEEYHLTVRPGKAPGAADDMEGMKMSMDGRKTGPMLDMQPIDFTDAPFSWFGLGDVQNAIYDMFGDMMGSILEAFPVPEPSSVPTPGPTPTDMPTTTSTVSVSVSLTMQGLDASAINDNDIEAIAVGLASVIDGVEPDDIYNIKVVDASTDDIVARRSLLSTAATVSFDVMVDVASEDSDFASADELADEVAESMDEVAEDSTTLITAIKEEVQSQSDDDAASSKWDDVEDVSDVDVVENTRPPTAAPTCGTKCNNQGDDGGSGDDVDAAGAIVGSLFGALAILAGGGIAAFYHKHKRLPSRHDLPTTTTTQKVAKVVKTASLKAKAVTKVTTDKSEPDIAPSTMENPMHADLEMVEIDISATPNTEAAAKSNGDEAPSGADNQEASRGHSFSTRRSGRRHTIDLGRASASTTAQAPVAAKSSRRASMSNASMSNAGMSNAAKSS